MCTEACLCLAKITASNSRDKSSARIKEGLKCLDISTKTLQNEAGKIVSDMASSYYYYYSQILSELKNLSDPAQHRWSKREEKNRTEGWRKQLTMYM